MSNLDIQVLFNQPGSYDQDQMISGKLTIIATANVTCRKIVFYGQRFEQKPEILVTKPMLTQTLAKWQSWVDGQEYSYPFIFDLENDVKHKNRGESTGKEWYFLPEIHIVGEFEPDRNNFV